MREKAADRLAHAQELAAQVDVEHGTPVLQALFVIAASFWFPAFATRMLMRRNVSTNLSNVARTLVLARDVGLEPMVSPSDPLSHG